jgi:hypothetical protein
MAALQNMEEPKTGADLVKYVAAVNWMRSAIPNFAERVSPLQAVFNKGFDGKTRRTKKQHAQWHWSSFGETALGRLSRTSSR